jgi:hypothetical protein
VKLLVESGAHLHADEKGVARMLKKREQKDGEKRQCWEIAGA